MSTYVYGEGCGYESEPFEAASDEAARAHVEATFRSPENPDFDGDEGRLTRVKVDPEGGCEDREIAWEWEGENMIPDPFNQRGSFGGRWH